MIRKIIFYYLKNGEIKILSPFERARRFFLFISKIGVISHNDLVFLKKRYPLQAKKFLKQILLEDLHTLFPPEKYEFYYQIIQEYPSEIEVNLWIYEKALKERLSQESCSAFLLEPLAYTFKEPTIVFFKDKNFVFIYSQEGKILNYSNFPLLNRENLNIVLKGSKPHPDTKWIIYGDLDPILKDFLPENMKVEVRENPPYPIFLDFINLKKIKPFSLKSFEFSKIDVAFLLRIVIYLFLGVSLNYYLSIKAYEREISEIEKKIKTLTNTVKNPSNTPVEAELLKLRQKKQDPLYILNSLANLLPQNTNIIKFSLSEETLELSLSTPDPLLILNNLYFEDCFTTIKLASNIKLEEGTYQIDLKIGLKKCRLTENI